MHRRTASLLHSSALHTGLPLAATLALHAALTLPWAWLWLASVNLWLFLLMARDKSAARTPAGQRRRLPEVTLLWLTFLGATPAMLLSRALFRHKTSKESFVHALYGIIALQLGLLMAFRATLLPLLLG